MLRKPDDRTPPEKFVSALDDQFDEDAKVPPTFAERLDGVLSQTIQLRGGAYPDPDDNLVEVDSDSEWEHALEETLSDDWSDERVYVTVFDLSQDGDERSTLVYADPYDDDSRAWIVSRREAVDRLGQVVDAGVDDDWAVYHCYRNGERFLTDLHSETERKMIDATKAESHAHYDPAEGVRGSC